MVVSIQEKMADFTIEPLSSGMEAKYRAFLRDYDFAPADEKIFAWYRNLAGTTMYVSTDNGKIVASGMSIPMGRTGWLGAICTHDDYRGIGLGRALTQRTIDRLRIQGAETILLRASEEGARLYRKMGFLDSGSYENFLVEQGDFKSPENDGFDAIKALSERHFTLDSEFTGELRKPVLSMLPGSTGYEVADGGMLEAFAFPSIGEGIVGMARDESLIPDMVAKLMSGRSGKVRTIKGNTLNRYMRELGFETKDGARRMVLGVDPVINKNGIIGTISSSIG